MIDIILGQRFQSFPSYEFVCFDCDGEIGCNLKITFEDSNRIGLSFSKFLIEFNCNLIGEYLDIVLCLCLEIHDELCIVELLLIVNLIFDLIGIECISFHEVDRDDVEFDLTGLEF